MLDALNFDYSDDEALAGRSLVTGVLGFRDQAGSGSTAVAGFNLALLQSGVVRDFIKEHQDRHQKLSTPSYARSHSEKKRDYLKYLVDKRGI